MSYTYSLNASQIIEMSTRMFDITSLTAPVESGDYSFALNILNMMIKSWEVEGIKLWKRRQGALFPSYNQFQYEIGSVSGSDNCSLVSDYSSTTLSSAAILGATSIVVTSNSGMTINDKIGIELSDLSRQWTTISNIAGTTITIADALTAEASSSATVISYTNKINRPLEILRGTVLDLTTGTETPLEKITFDQYFNLPVKSQLSMPINIYYDKILNNTLPYTSTLYMYGNPDRSSYIIKFSYYDAIQDVVNPTDTLDFPQEWQMAIVTNLAVLLATFGYGKLIEAQATMALAVNEKAKISAFDSDDEYLSFIVSNSRNIGS